MGRPPTAPVEYLIAACRAGYSHSEIGSALGVRRATIQRRLWKLGESIPERPPLPQPSPEWFAAIRDWALSVAAYAEEQRCALKP